MKRVHLVSIDTEGHDSLVLEGLKDSLAKGLIDVLEFEFNSQLGSWNARSTQRRTLGGVLTMLESYSYGCFWQTGLGCLAPASGMCYKPAFERVGWSNLVCARGEGTGQRAGRVGRGKGKGGGASSGAQTTPLAHLWELANECNSGGAES